MSFRRRSILTRLVLAFVAVGMITGIPLVLLSIEFNRRSSDVRLQQSISQQMAIIEDNFRQEFSTGLVRSLKQVTESDALTGYLLSSQGEHIVRAKTLEKSLLGVQGAFENYTGIYYVNGEGEFVVNVVDLRRSVELGNVLDAEPTRDGHAGLPTRQALRVLFERIRTVPLLLSSGNMEWFMPPREVTIEGPFKDEQGRLSLLAGLPLVDYDSGGFGGVVFIRVQLEEFAKRLQSVRVLDGSPVWLFAGDGKVLLQPPPSMARLDPTPFLPSGVSVALRVIKAESGLIAFQDLSIVRDKAFIRLAYTVPSSAISRDYQPAIYFFVLVLLLSLLAVCLLAYAVSKNFSTPIIQLAEAAARLARGDMSSRVSVPATGEIRVLVDSFNQMTDKLQSANQNRANAFAVLRNTVIQMQTERTGRPSRPADLPPMADSAPAPLVRDDSEDLGAIKDVIDNLLQEREENLRKVRSAKESADEANRAKGDFLATMSHEIRTPLNAVIGLSDILGGTELSPEQRHLVRTMESAGGQLLQIINDILDFSRLQSGRVALNEVGVDLPVFMQRLMLLIGGLPDAMRLDIRSSIDPAVPTRILTDEARLLQILTNLMGNAVKFTPQGSVRIHVATELTESGESMLRFTVTDTGPGISPEMRDAIFDPFTQGVAERLRPHAGSGLGLAICRRLAHAMQGNIVLADAPGAGACFVLTLPLKSAPESGVERVVERSSSFVGAGLRILVAEDTPANQLVIQMILQGMGHSVTMTSDGLQAVDAFAAATFDLVILDIQMPVMDGYEAARQIRAAGPAGQVVPIIALTAFTQNSDRDKAQASGVTDFVSKPIRARDVRAMLERLGLTGGSGPA